MPQIDHTGKVAVSLYGKGTVEGDTPIQVDGGGMTLTNKAITLLAAAARTTPGADQLGTAVTGVGQFRRWIILLNLTAAATEVGDTLDVYVDFSLDGTTWLNAIHFAQLLGNGGAKKFFAIIDPTNPGTAPFDATANAAVNTVRPAVTGAQVRVRWTLVDAGTQNASFNFGVTALATA